MPNIGFSIKQAWQVVSQFCFDVGPASKTLAQHQNEIGSMTPEHGFYLISTQDIADANGAFSFNKSALAVISYSLLCRSLKQLGYISPSGVHERSYVPHYKTADMTLYPSPASATYMLYLTYFWHIIIQSSIPLPIKYVFSALQL